jgi:serine/threonine-protein kinase HipA
MSRPRRVKQLVLHTTQGDAGRLLRESQFVVRYSDAALSHPERALSLAMPPRPDGYRTNQVPPVLAMNLPEGFLRDRVLERYRKVMDVDDDMNMLAVTSTPAAGRVYASTTEEDHRGAGEPISLRDILAHHGTELLFDELLEKYATASISGVQPKVLVPERPDSELPGGAGKSAVKSPDLIVKSAGAEYPGLAENEFHCMSIARHVGLETPEFHLSDDRELFVIRRFDLAGGRYLGFEDLAALTGRHPSRKYDGSYGVVARAVGDFAAPVNGSRSLEALFRLIVLNCLIRNGDAHLKNFGILYGDPASATHDARLAPVYDLVCTTLYLPKDTLALSLGGSKAWPERSALEQFGRESCHVLRPGAIIDEVAERAMDYRPRDARSKTWKALRAEIEKGVHALKATRRGPRTGAARARRAG